MSNSKITVEAAERVLNHDYWDDVRGVAEEAKRLIKDGECDDEESWRDLVEQHVDGHQRVIYTHQARLGMCFTNNPDAYEENIGEKPETVEAAIMQAMLADVWAMLPDYDDVVSELAEESEEAQS